MLRSVDYAARTAIDQQRQRGVGPVAEAEALAIGWRAEAERTFLHAYRAARENASGQPTTTGGELLSLFLADKLFYEIGFEGAHRPVLLSIPVKAALELLEPLQEAAEEAVE
jgi:maltose alpha-D-glucosyltransferase/alpha-amylase